FHAPPTPLTSTLSLHDALPISHSVTLKPKALRGRRVMQQHRAQHFAVVVVRRGPVAARGQVRVRRIRCAGGPLRTEQMRREIERSEEHTSELQSLAYLVCRLLL